MKIPENRKAELLLNGKRRSLVFQKGDIYSIKGSWGVASCEYLGIQYNHHLFESLNGHWRISFTLNEVDFGLVYEWFPFIQPVIL